MTLLVRHRELERMNARFCSGILVAAACWALGCTPPPTPPIQFQAGNLAREPMDALLESAKKIGLYPASVTPGLIETRWEETAIFAEPLLEKKTKLVRRYLLRIEKRAFGHQVTISVQARRCIPSTLRFGETDVEGQCAEVPTLPPPLVTELNRTADRIEQQLAIP